MPLTNRNFWSILSAIVALGALAVLALLVLLYVRWAAVTVALSALLGL